MIITSPSNPRIKSIRKLADRKFREEQGEYYIEGLRIVGEAFEHHADLVTVLYSPDLLTSEFGQRLVEQAVSQDIEVLALGADAFTRLSLKEGPQGIAAVGRQVFTRLEELSPANGEVWIALDSVQDPGNLGTILRTGDATGCKGVILLDHSTDPYDPTALRASMGAVYGLKLVKARLTEFAAWKERQHILTIGTSDKARVYYRDFHYRLPMVLLMGSEKMGLTPDHLRLCDEVVSMPMLGTGDSLNLAVATGVVLYEIVHQTRMNLE